MSQPNPNKRVVVGISGGVDSAVAAKLLLEQGHHVEALFMKNWEEDDDADYCAATEDLNDAQQVCDTLGIRLHTVNFSGEYWERVFQYFLTEYQAGRTPNPDIMCNKEIKFRAFLDYAMHLGADAIATGHYARICKRKGSYHLLKGIDVNKDQSYFLYTLGQPALSRTLFPLGELEKKQVRALAKQSGFTNHNKKDSTGICFIGERKFRDFLLRYVPSQPGEICTPTGECIGEHIGLMFYTIGQRQGLGIGGIPGVNTQPWYVVHKDLPQNRLIVAQGNENPLLFKATLTATHLTWTDAGTPSYPLHCHAKTRYRQADQLCAVTANGIDSLKVEFTTPQRAITPGQSVVFYQSEVCLGGGIIE